MGCDISILSKHNLNISSVKTLAIDLAERLNLNIEYGYFSSKEHNNLLGIDLDDELTELGSIMKNNSGEKYILVDENFQKKLLHEKFGDQLFDMVEYWNCSNENLPDEEVKLAEKKDILLTYFYLFSDKSTEAEGYLMIHDEILMNDLYYYSRWWQFCKTIQTKDQLKDDYFQSFRRSIMKSTLALGGDKAYFVNDQCRHLAGVGQGNEIYYNWNELEQFINSREKLEVISISKAITSDKYQIEVSGKNDRNLAFFDDFGGLEGN